MENLEAVRRWSKWRPLKSRSALASRIKTIFALILSGVAVSRDSFGFPQESVKHPQDH
jgi:hypothetical protein